LAMKSFKIPESGLAKAIKMIFCVNEMIF
jgi:hypothetical protein